MTATKSKLTVLILTYNEQRYIQELLEQIQFADEIIVVDSFSSDHTSAIVQSFANVKLVQHKFINYADQRNYALAQATNNWVLFLDADERLTPKLQKEILEKLEQNSDTVAFSMPRVFMFKNKAMRFTGTQNDYVLRLFNTLYCSYQSDKLVHEKLEVNGAIEVLKGKMIHYTYYDYQIFKNKVIKYGILKAKEKNIKGTKYNVVMHILHPVFTFISYYFLKLGFLDGVPGLVLSYLFSYSVYARYNELKRLQA